MSAHQRVSCASLQQCKLSTRQWGWEGLQAQLQAAAPGASAVQAG